MIPRRPRPQRGRVHVGSDRGPTGPCSCTWLPLLLAHRTKVNHSEEISTIRAPPTQVPVMTSHRSGPRNAVAGELSLACFVGLVGLATTTPACGELSDETGSSGNGGVDASGDALTSQPGHDASSGGEAGISGDASD